LIALIHQHEIGHCNGWPASRPGGRWVEYDPDSRGKARKIGHLNVTF
jgi:hypothetical protein